MCCYREIKNYERFNLIVQSMICLTVSQLKGIAVLIENRPAAVNKNNNSASSSSASASNGSNENHTVKCDGDKTVDEVKLDPKSWSLPEVEKLLILISKAFLLNFPLYIAYKHGVHSRLDDISAQEAQVTPLLISINRIFTDIFVFNFRT